MKKITFWMFILLVSIQLNAQVWNITSCSPVLGTNTYGPMFSAAAANSGNRTAIIYPSSQLAGIAGQNLNKMFFKRSTAAGTMAGTPNFKIYLKEVSAADFGAANLDWATQIASATLVYDSNPATVVGNSAGWKGFPLSTSFLYSGTQNLAVFFEYVNTTASTLITWDYEYTAPCITTTNSNTSKYLNIATGILPATLTNSNYRRPLIAFDYPVSCPAPTALTATGINSTGVTLNWTNGAAETQWEYLILPTGSPAPIATTMGTLTSVNPITITTLLPLTGYQAYVRAVCGATDKSFWTGPIAFNTSLVPGCATTIAPVDGATNVSVGTKLFSWSAPTTGDPATSYDLFSGNTAGTVTNLVGNFTSTSASLGINNYNATIYWKVVPKNAGGSAVGCLVNSFTTEATSPGYCLGAVESLYPTATYTPAVCDGTTVGNIATDAFAGEYSNVNVISGNTYEFRSVKGGTANDFITISTNDGVTAAAYGVSPLTWVATSTGVVRFYSHLTNQCTGDPTNRTRSVICSPALATNSFDLTGFSLSPNPVTDVLNISYTQDISKISVMNIVGQEIMTKLINATHSKIDMSSLTNGIYLVKVSVGDLVNTIKIIKE